MGKTLREIAEQLKATDKKVQLIYAFNGTGKTRLSREFKQFIAPKDDEGNLPRNKIIYYNAFTEDLFYWDNDLKDDTEPRLKVQPNTFTDWVLNDQGQDINVISKFQHYTNEKLTPHFNAESTKKDDSGKPITVKAFSEITFTMERGDETHSGQLKISKGEESCFIWSIFFTLLEQIVEVLNVAEPTERETNQFDHLQYVFIDDPVSSLDENNLIQLAVDLAGLITSSESDVKFIITTHNPLFYNVIYNELNSKCCYFLEGFEDGSFSLIEKKGDSNQSFSYHLHLRDALEKAIAANQVKRYHFTLLRNLYEKTANFLGYPRWSELLPEEKKIYLNRIIQFTSHKTLSNEEISDPSPQEKQTVKFLLDNLIDNYSYWKK